MQDTGIPVFEMRIVEDGSGISRGLSAISLVDDPAIKVNFLTFRKDAKMAFALDEAKMVVTGPVLIPDLKIYKVNPETGKEYYVYTTAAEIEKAAIKFSANGYENNTTHMHEIPLEGNTIYEKWIIEDPKNDKAAALGFQNLPKGTLMASMKIGSKEYWQNEIVSGNVKGFSIEGFYSLVPTNQVIPQNKKQPVVMSIQNKVTLALHNAGVVKLSETELQRIKNEGAAATVEPAKPAASEPAKTEHAKQAAEAFITEDNEVLIMKDGVLVPAPDGQYTINGKLVTVVGGEAQIAPAPATDPSKQPATATPPTPTGMEATNMIAQFASQLAPITEALVKLDKRLAKIEAAKPVAVTKAVEMVETVTKTAPTQAQLITEGVKRALAN